MRYPKATWYPSKVSHANRPATWGIVIHWTAGHKAGDLATLTGGSVDVQFYVDKAGEVYQLLDSDSEAWHAFHTANTYTVGIEHEGSGEPWTDAQFNASVSLVRWLSDLYRIPVKHVDPHSDWHGIMGHRDLQGIDENNHEDTVPSGTGWAKYVAAIVAAGQPSPAEVAANAKRLKVLRTWIMTKHAAGWAWLRLKVTANWREYIRLGGK